MINLFVHDPRQLSFNKETSIQIFSSKSEAFASELLENIENMFSMYFIHETQRTTTTRIISREKTSITSALSGCSRVNTCVNNQYHMTIESEGLTSKNDDQQKKNSDAETECTELSTRERGRATREREGGAYRREISHTEAPHLTLSWRITCYCVMADLNMPNMYHVPYKQVFNTYLSMGVLLLFIDGLLRFRRRVIHQYVVSLLAVSMQYQGHIY